MSTRVSTKANAKVDAKVERPAGRPADTAEDRPAEAAATGGQGAAQAAGADAVYGPGPGGGLAARQSLDRILEDSQRMDPGSLPELLRQQYAGFGVDRLIVYLADLQQNLLVALPGSDTGDGQPPRLSIDSSLAGWTYRTLSPRIAQNDTSLTLWLPMMAGVERLGVLSVQLPALDPGTLARCRTLAALVALIVVNKNLISDAYAYTQRTRPMQLPAEMVWAFLPPRTIGTDQVTSSAVVEPAYDLGGDAFDHALCGGVLHASILDAMGHDLASGLTSAVALAGIRNTRRRGGSLADIVATIDNSIEEVFADRYVTAILAQLDTATGRLRWANCGHPPPLLLRGGTVLHGALERRAEVPLGLGPRIPGTRRRIHQTQLQPGDRVLLYTDGVVDARSASGERFGEQRFAEFMIRAMEAGEPAPEVLRRLIHAILNYQSSRFTDDATILLFEWHPDTAGAPPGSAEAADTAEEPAQGAACPDSPPGETDAAGGALNGMAPGM